MDTKYTVCLQGNVIETTITCKASVVREWINDVKSTAHIYQNIVGMDHIYEDGKSVLLQFCIGTKCLLYQSLYSDQNDSNSCPGRGFLYHCSFVFAGVDVASKFEGNNLRPCNYVDIEALAVVRWCWPMKVDYTRRIASALGTCWKPGLKVLAKSIAGLNIERPNPIRFRCNWESKELSVEQIEYACIGVYASFRVGYHLLKHGNDAMPNMMMKSADDDDEDDD